SFARRNWRRHFAQARDRPGRATEAQLDLLSSARLRVRPVIPPRSSSSPWRFRSCRQDGGRDNARSTNPSSTNQEQFCLTNRKDAEEPHSVRQRQDECGCRSLLGTETPRKSFPPVFRQCPPASDAPICQSSLPTDSSRLPALQCRDSASSR